MNLFNNLKSLYKDVKGELSHLVPTNEMENKALVQTSSPQLKIKMPGATEYVELGKNQIKHIYKDPIGPRLLVIIDESAELLKPSGVKNKEGKEEDQLKQEMAMIIQSLAQLGRSAGVHLIICTQRAEVAAIAGGNTRENSLALNTKVLVKNG